jgi:hypothetical protein
LLGHSKAVRDVRDVRAGKIARNGDSGNAEEVGGDALCLSTHPILYSALFIPDSPDRVDSLLK